MVKRVTVITVPEHTRGVSKVRGNRPARVSVARFTADAVSATPIAGIGERIAYNM